MIKLYSKKNKVQSQPAATVQKKNADTPRFFLKDNRTNSYIVQRAISMKGEGKAERSTGNLKSLRTEVRDTISKNKPSDMLSTIDQLRKSIDSREREQAGKPKGTKKYQTEQYRIDQEKIFLGKVQEAYDTDLAARRQKKADKEAARQKEAPKGFKVVGKSGKAK